ncbi:serine hydrolase [Bacillus sp. REN3]|uniref:serine hydrolase n=1 Tax=Bacillus sp. REN3 TaxID=2802440 RepID=UPI001AEE204A|nr:serine hydrolase [Bacillus sp. REN3]
MFLDVDGDVIEYRSGEIYQAASLIKLPIMLEAFQRIKAGTIPPEQMIVINQEDKIGDTGILQALKQDSMSFMDLITLMIIVSDNSATNILIDLLGMQNINQNIKKLDLNKTVLQRKMLDFTQINSGKDNFTAAADIAACLKAGAEGSINPSFFSILEKQQFKDKLPAFISLDIKVGNKTGELNGVQHDCAILDYNNHRIYVAVLIDQLVNREEGSSTIRQIGRHLNDFLIGHSQ